MAGQLGKVGIVGGTGMLGRTIARALLDRGGVAPGDLWLSNRGGTLGDLELPGAVSVTADSAALAANCETVILSVPPAQAAALGLDMAGKLVISVMAGVTLDQLATIAGADRVVRAMSSPAAELGLAFSPWVAGPGISQDDRARVTAIFTACGETAELTDEDHIDVFTALTGPVPGFVAYFADCMAGYASDKGIPTQIADRAIRQLFLASGRVLAEGGATPAAHVQAMVDYAGTTAAGLQAMRAAPIRSDISKALDAAVARARTIAAQD